MPFRQRWKSSPQRLENDNRSCGRNLVRIHRRSNRIRSAAAESTRSDADEDDGGAMGDFLEAIRGHFRGGATRRAMIVSSSKRCASSPSRTSRGVALRAEYRHWNTVRKQFSRFSRNGVFEAFFQALAELSPTAGRCRCSIVHSPRPRLRGGRKGGSTRRRPADRAAASRPKSISRPISTTSRSPFI